MVLPGPSCLCGDYGSPAEHELMDQSTDLPVCDYDENPTPLYIAMEQHHWGAVSRFLKTGVWPGNFFSDKQPPRMQVRTWVHRYDTGIHELRDDQATDASTYHSYLKQSDSVPPPPRPSNVQIHRGRYLRWRQLPLHAALIFMAPPVIVRQLIEAFPYALRCPDDKGMLPLHLAFRQAVPDDILTVLLRLFPNGMHVRDQKGRLPVECVRTDVMNNEGIPPLRGMIIQSIMQQSKDKFSRQQQDTIQSFQKDIQQLAQKMSALEQQLVAMDEREKNTRQELTSTLDQLSALKKNHRKLQELQRFAMQRQSEQESLDKQQQSFQQRLLEQLDLAQVPIRSSPSRSRSRSRGRSASESRGRSNERLDPGGSTRVRSKTRRDADHNRDRPPSPPPSVRREDSRGYSVSRRTTQRQPSQSSFEDEDTPSYSSGVSRFTEFTKGLPSAYTANTAFTGKSAQTREGTPALFRSPSNGTRATHATHTTFQTQAQMAMAAETAEDESVTNTQSLHQYQSLLDRPKARSLYPLATRSESTTNGGPTSKLQQLRINQSKAAQAVAAATTTTSNNNTKPQTASACGVADSQTLNWDFSFTPGFLQPLSINEL